MLRREVLAAGMAVLAMPAIGAETRVLRFVPQADLAVLDPVWTTAYQTRDHGFLVFDTLFGQDAAFRTQPQMVAGVETSTDGLVWRLTLREGLRFHDGTPVLARDCAASVRRWGARDGFGQALMAAAGEVGAESDRVVRFRLRAPFPLLPDALAKTSPSACFMMPERLAATDPYTQVTEMVGSGPFRYLAGERVAGSRVVYERFLGYVPRGEGVASRTAGPKVAHFDRVEWQIIQDSATAAAALQQGEVDWWFVANTDLLPVLRGNAGVRVAAQDPAGIIATMRFNQLQAPFDNAAVRRALLPAIVQADYMTAVSGPDRALWADGVGYFCPGTPMASDAGMAALTGPRSVDAAKRGLESAGYKGERVALLLPTDIESVRALAEVTADLFRKLGLNVDAQTMDWPTAIQRRANRGPVEQGGWSVFQTSWSGTDQLNPAVHVFLRGNGTDAAPGWPSSARIEALRGEWFRAGDLSAQKAVARAMQEQAFRDLPYIPLGQQFQQTAYRAEISGILTGLPVFWNVRRG